MFVTITADLSNLSPNAFWQEMQSKGWDYLYKRGVGPLSPKELPATVSDMEDDPYRSLADAARDDGAYQKTTILYADFLWADFFRSRINLGTSDQDFAQAENEADGIAHTPAAENLPGYTASKK
jgi:hypothetical protein